MVVRSGGEPADLMRAAVAAGDWSRLEQVVGEHWVVLVRDHWDPLCAAAAQVPPDVLAPAGYLRLVVEVLLLQPLGALSLPGGRPDDQARTESGDLRLALTTGVAQVAILRRSGRFDESVEVMDRLERLAAQAARDPGSVRDVLPVAWLQSAIGRLLVGDLDAATRLFGQARTAPPTEATSFVPRNEATSFVPRNSANSIALVLAMDGDLPHVRDWLDVADAAPEPEEGWLLPMVRATGLAAAALVGVDELDRDAADAALRALGDPTGPDEHWVFNLWARVRYALSWGDPEEMLRRVDMACNAHVGLTGGGGAAQALLLAARLELLLALGRGNRVLTLLEQDAGHRLSLLAVARAWLLTGRPDTALMVLARPGPSPVHGVHVVEGQVLLAQVQLRLGRRAAAGEAFRRALLRAGSTGAVRPFTTLPADERDELTELAGGAGSSGSAGSTGSTGSTGSAGAAPDVPDPARVQAARQVFPAQATLVTLSERERVVLFHLAQGLTSGQIAQALFVSVNTVKSQVRSVYRKLEVGSRPEAIARGYELDLLRGDG